MELVKLGLATDRQGSTGGLTQKSVKEPCHRGGRAENESLGEFRVGELVVGE